MMKAHNCFENNGESEGEDPDVYSVTSDHGATAYTTAAVLSSLSCTVTLCYFLLGQLLYISTAGDHRLGLILVTSLLLILGAVLLFVVVYHAFVFVRYGYRLSADDLLFRDDSGGLGGNLNPDICSGSGGSNSSGRSGGGHGGGGGRSGAGGEHSLNSLNSEGFYAQSGESVIEYLAINNPVASHFPLALAAYLATALLVETLIGDCAHLRGGHQLFCVSGSGSGGGPGVPLEDMIALLVLPLMCLVCRPYGMGLDLGIGTERGDVGVTIYADSRLEVGTYLIILAGAVASVAVAAVGRSSLPVELMQALFIYALGAPAMLLTAHTSAWEALQLRWRLQRLVAEADRHKAAYATEMRHMIANVAHDLKTPLTSYLSGLDHIGVILSDIKALSDAGELTPEECLHQVESVEGCLDSIRYTSSFMIMTINRCIDTTKASSGVALVPSIETVELRQTVLLPIRTMLDLQDRVKVVLHSADMKRHLLCSHIRTDKQWLQENLLCLISNAVKYSPAKSRVDVRVSLLTHLQLCRHFPSAVSVQSGTGSEDSAAAAAGAVRGMISSSTSSSSAQLSRSSRASRSLPGGSGQSEISVGRGWWPSLRPHIALLPSGLGGRGNAVAPAAASPPPLSSTSRKSSAHARSSRGSGGSRLMNFRFDHLSMKVWEGHGAASDQVGCSSGDGRTQSGDGNSNRLSARLFSSLARRTETRSGRADMEASGMEASDTDHPPRRTGGGAPGGPMNLAIDAALGAAMAASADPSRRSWAGDSFGGGSFDKESRSWNEQQQRHSQSRPDALGAVAGNADESSSSWDSKSNSFSNINNFGGGKSNSHKEICDSVAQGSAGGSAAETALRPALCRAESTAGRAAEATLSSNAPQCADAGGRTSSAAHSGVGDVTHLRFVVFEVRDRGAGLNAQERAAMFSPARQAQRLAGGAGLGLFSLAVRTRALGGLYGVKVRDDDKSGSVFWMALPYEPDLGAARSAEELLAKEVHTTLASNSSAAVEVPVTAASTVQVATGVLSKDSTALGPPSLQLDGSGLANSNTTAPTPATPTPVSAPTHAFTPVDAPQSPTLKPLWMKGAGAADASAGLGGAGGVGEGDVDAASLAERVKRIKASAATEAAISAASASSFQRAAARTGGRDEGHVRSHTQQHTHTLQLQPLVPLPAPLSSSVGSDQHVAAGGTSSRGSVIGGDGCGSVGAKPSALPKPSSEFPAMASTAALPGIAPGNHNRCRGGGAGAGGGEEEVTGGVGGTGKDNLRILVVDDSISILKITGLMLTRQGHHVDKAENGVEALCCINEQFAEIGKKVTQAATQGSRTVNLEGDKQGQTQPLAQGSHRTEAAYDVVLMDLQMPIMGGLETVQKIRAAEQGTGDSHSAGGNRAHQVVICMSANSDPETKADALRVGADAFLPKPFSYNAFKDTLLSITQRLDTTHPL